MLVLSNKNNSVDFLFENGWQSSCGASEKENLKNSTQLSGLNFDGVNTNFVEGRRYVCNKCTMPEKITILISYYRRFLLGWLTWTQMSVEYGANYKFNTRNVELIEPNAINH
jgi:hypothetical protein